MITISTIDRKPAGFTLLLALLRPARVELSFSILASCASGVASLALVALINRALVAPATELAQVGWAFASAGLIALGCRWFSEDRFARLGQDTLARLRSDVCRRIGSLSYARFEQVGLTPFRAASSDDASTVAHAISVVPGVCINAALVLAGLCYLAALSPRVFLLVALVVLVGCAAYYRVESRALGALRAARNKEDDVFRGFDGLLHGAKELRLHAARRRSFTQDGLFAHIDQARRLRSRGLRISVGASSVGALLFFAVIGVVIFVLGRLWRLDASVTSGYALVFLYLAFPLESLLGALPTLGRARVALERLAALPADREPATLLPQPEARFARLELREVTHSHRGAGGVEFVLGPIQLELRAGEIVFLVGGNGSGKTTLAKLLVGLYAPETGQLLFNGELLSEHGREAYRQCFSAIFSDFYLFDTLWGLEQGDDGAQVAALLAELELASRVSVEAGRFSTTSLSQGQRKRLALLVAELEQRPCLLFDEWAADQDPAHKELFYRRVLPALRRRGKTVIVITHDDRYFDAADRCLKLEAGRIVAELRSEPRSAEPSQCEPGAPRAARRRSIGSDPITEESHELGQ